MRATPPLTLPPARARLLAVTLILALGLTGCARFAQSNFNPLNWFKGAQPVAPTVLYVPPADKRLLVAQVLTLKVDRNPNGAIVRATGLPPTQGWWKADLVKVDQDDTTKIVFEFRLYPPVAPAPAGTPLSREITVATSLTNIALDGVRTIVVQGASNALSSRR
jgi:hypothetical protein